MKRRPKYIAELVNRANEYMRINSVKDPNKSELFQFVNSVLLDYNMYEGYNFYKCIDTNEQEDKLVLAGTTDPDKFDCIQFM